MFAAIRKFLFGALKTWSHVVSVIRFLSFAMPAEPGALFAAVGIRDSGPFIRALSYSNEVWVGRTVVLPLSPLERAWTSAREQDVLARLPDAVPHAELLGSGTYESRPWLLLRRMPGAGLMTACQD